MADHLVGDRPSSTREGSRRTTETKARRDRSIGRTRTPAETPGPALDSDPDPSPAPRFRRVPEPVSSATPRSRRVLDPDPDPDPSPAPRSRRVLDPDSSASPQSRPSPKGPPSEPVAPRRRIDPRFRQRRIEVKREAGRKRLRVLVAGTTVLVTVAAGLGLARSPALAVHHLRVAGTQHLSSADVVAASGLAGRHQLLDVNGGSVSRRIEQLPWVATASVRREWPTTVRVVVTERVPVATLLGPSGMMAVDAAGRVLAAAPGELHVPALQVAAGVAASAAPAPGAVVDRMFDPGLAVAAAMPADLVPRVQAIVVGTAEDLRLRLVSGQDVLLGGTADIGPKLVAVLTLEVRQKLGPGTLDVTVPAAPVLTPPPGIGNFSTRTGG